MSLAIYAPNSTVDYTNNLKFIGAIVGQVADAQEQLRSSRTTAASPASRSGSNSRFYQSYDYKECASAPTSSTPNSGC